ncbi:hypothetical protein niasHT_005247 [Heterodera trifolii]|uniref:Protein kinase domain-containing protein n=1 Tax=Heterodera trifolii TaxID=157864 RepID=A0ABD2LS48_9BILA
MLVILLLQLHFSAAASTAAGVTKKRSDSTGHLVTKIGNEFKLTGIVTNGDLFVIATDKSLSLFKFDGRLPISEPFVPFRVIPLPLELPLTDLKIDLANSILVICTEVLCRLCPIYANSSDNGTCRIRHLPGTVRSLRTVVGNQKRLFVRAIYGSKNASVHAFDDFSVGGDVLGAIDDRGISQHSVVASFRYGQYAFFVGSAVRADLPLFVSETLQAERMDVRLSRVCLNDRSRSGSFGLESRMELVLSCRGLGDDNDDDAFLFPLVSHQKAVVAAKTSDGVGLLVVLERVGKEGTRNQFVCHYDLAQLNAAFDATWDACQNTETDSTKGIQQCLSQQMEPAHCHVFSWELNSRTPLCYRFNLGTIKSVFSNCELNSTDIKVNRAGWLENFRPTNGTVLARLSVAPNFTNVSTIENAGKNAFWVGRENGTIERWTSINEAHGTGGNESFSLLWSLSTNSTHFGPFDLAMLSDKNHLLYRDGNEVRLLPVDCAGLYPKCEDIFWNDPLHCKWCAFQNSTGHTVSSPSDANSMDVICPRGYLLDGCPPAVSEVVPSVDGSLNIYGKHLNSLENFHVSLCDSECANLVVKSDLIRCKIPSSQFHCDDLFLSGSMGNVSNMRFLFKMPFASDRPSPVLPSSNFTYAIRIVLGVTLLLLLFSVLVLFYCVFYPKYSERLLKRLGNSNLSSNEFSSSSSYTPIPLTEPRFILGPQFTKETFSPVRFDHMDGQKNVVLLSDGSELDLSNWDIIGGGHFAKVCKAKWHRNSADCEGNYVAVKIIRDITENSYSAIQKEVEAMSRCEHPNIVRYIGFFGSDQLGPLGKELGLINIVMEFMGGKDLHGYLINEKISPTIGNAFSFISQIVEGMAYMSSRRIVHRDLAARNCLLDERFEVVKITDFGLSRLMEKSAQQEGNEYEYLGKNCELLPFRWTALECFGDNPSFSEKTDVWSFGVLMWEIFARNVLPFPNMTSKEVRLCLERGGRLSKLDRWSCPNELYQLMLRCWNVKPQSRPTFTEISVEMVEIVDHLLETDSNYMETQYEMLGPGHNEYETPTNSLRISVSRSDNDPGAVRSFETTSTSANSSETIPP